MAEIYLYIVGIVTGMFMILTSYYYSKYSDSLKENEKLVDENKKLNDKLSLRKRYEKKASIIWDTWHKKDSPNYTWAVTLYLKVVAMSDTNPNMFKFEVESHYSQNPNDGWSVNDYSNKFYEVTNDGWLDITIIRSNMKFNWISTHSIEEMRDSKLEDLGI
jgi:hypothetical protein